MPSPRRAPARLAGLAVAAVASATTLVGATFVLAGPAGATSVPADAEPVYVADGLLLADPVHVAGQARSALQRGDTTNYTFYSQKLATIIAPRAGVDPAALQLVWAAAAAQPQRMVALLSALTQLGVPYRRLGDTPGKSFDCSGLTSWAWAQSGVPLPHQSGGQISQVARTDLAAVRPGDLLYYPGHVMMSLGVGTAMVHAPNSGNVVEVKSLDRNLRAGDPLG